MLDPARFPRPPSLTLTTARIQIRFPSTGQVIASTTSAYRVLETHHPPTYYLPPSSIQIPLTKLPRQTFCEWKGVATYYSLALPDGTKVDSRAWAYEDPSPAFESIRGYISFYADPRWECTVDGEVVEPQPGDYYGGWMTKDILRASVKGAPGTRHW